MLGDQPGDRLAADELRGRDLRNPGERHAFGRTAVGHQRVIAVVDERGDQDLVDGLQHDRIDRRTLGPTRNGRDSLGARAGFVTHQGRPTSGSAELVIDEMSVALGEGLDVSIVLLGRLWQVVGPVSSSTSPR